MRPFNNHSGRPRACHLDDQNLFSAKYGLTGRPDRIDGEGGLPIPEEWKRSKRVYPSHIAQINTYFILLEEGTGIRPPHGYIVLQKGKRARIENSDELRARMQEIADHQDRAATGGRTNPGQRASGEVPGR